MKRILVTGARGWQQHGLIKVALLNHAKPGRTVLVHGNAPGVDRWADFYWRCNGFGVDNIERYPARDFSDPKARNAHMVELGADLVLAFALKWASGTGNCARLARRKAIPVSDYGVSTAWEDRP